MTAPHSVVVRDVVKDYRIYANPGDRLLEHLPFSNQQRHQVFRALKGVSFDIRKGETIGLIGPNGSGKSTLLEILCGTLSATSGTVSVQGRIAALLELGAGFNPEFTGRENVFLNAAIMGISREFVESRFDEVREFAEIGDYIDRPVKTYSSGMYVRLAFAAAINMDPEILIVDEALSVGDIGFQRKCYRYFQDLQRLGVTIIFVTHAMELIRSHCHRAIYIEGGEVRQSGEPRDVVHAYLNRTFTRPQASGEEHQSSSQFTDQCVTRRTYNASEYRWGNRQAEIIDYRILDKSGEPVVQIERGTRLRLEMDVGASVSLDHLIYGLTIKSVDGITVYGANSRARGLGEQALQSGQVSTIAFEFSVNLIAAEYFISLGVAQDDDSVDNLAIDRRYDLIHLTVSGSDGDFGLADLQMQIVVD